MTVPLPSQNTTKERGTDSLENASMPSLVGMHQGETGWLEGSLANQSCIERTRLNTRAMVGRKYQAQGWYLEQGKLPGRTERSVSETLGCRLLRVKDLCPSI